MSYCPACGNPVSDASARFCMKCGRELSAAPPAPPAAPPAPAYAAPPPSPPPAYTPTASYPAAPPPQGPPPPAQPSPAGLFLRRVFSGRWDGAVLAALVPALVLLVVSGALGSWSQHAFRGSAIGWFKRSRIALTLAVQGLGGHVSVHRGDDPMTGSDCSDSDSDSDYYGDDDDYSDDYGSDDYSDYSGDMCGSGAGSASLSVVPLTFTLLWILALVLVLRSVRRRPGGTGPEAAVRVALLSAAAATVLAFVAQPSIEGVTLHSGPFRVLLWSFVISLVTALVVLNGPALRARFAAPARVVGTAATALLVTVLFAGVVVFVIALANTDNGVTGDTLVVFGTVLPNLGVSGLALGWGAPLKLKETSPSGHDAYDFSFGLSQLSHIWNGWATVLALLGGVVCALAIGLLASARARDRAEQFAVAGVFTVMFTVLVSIGGFTSGGTDLASAVGGDLGPAGSKIGSAMPESLLFALLWSVGGVLAAPYARRVLGMAPSPAGGAAAAPSPYAPPPFPYVPQQQQQSPQPQQSPPPEVHDLGIVQPDRLTKDDRTRRDEGGGRHQ